MKGNNKRFNEYLLRMNEVNKPLGLRWNLYHTAEDERLMLYESHDAILREFNVSGMLMYPELKISQHQSLVGHGLPLRDDGVACRALGPDEVLRPDSVIHSAVLGLSDRGRE